jgi:hypothetical protein
MRHLRPSSKTIRGIVMKAFYETENDRAPTDRDTAGDICWREHRIKPSHLRADLAIMMAVLVVLSLASGFADHTGSAQHTDASAAHTPLPVFVKWGALTHLPQPPEEDRDR